MSIPESQLQTWSHQGSISQSAQTYGSIKAELEAPHTPLSGRSKTVFLQGSYGNDTNIYAESDVDIVLLCDEVFFYKLEEFSPDQQAAFRSSTPPAQYSYSQFKQDALNTLVRAYGNSVVSGNKAIRVPAEGVRRKADVVAAFEFRRYYSFGSGGNHGYHSGICFVDSAGQQIENFPRHHSENVTAKHQRTSNQFKPMVRMMKNLRGALIERGMLADGDAPSYFIEGLLYNVPDAHFSGSRSASFTACMSWLGNADKDALLCANERFYLLNEFSPVTWRREKCDKFLGACSRLWNSW